MMITPRRTTSSRLTNKRTSLKMIPTVRKSLRRKRKKLSVRSSKRAKKSRLRLLMTPNQSLMRFRKLLIQCGYILFNDLIL